MGTMMSKYVQWRSLKGCFEVRINARVCEREPLLATCCTFMEQYFIVLDLTPDGKRYLVLLTPKDASGAKKAAGNLAGAFYNELLHNQLRYRISSRNQKIREMIVQEALFFSQPRKEQAKVARQLLRKEQSG